MAERREETLLFDLLFLENINQSWMKNDNSNSAKAKDAKCEGKEERKEGNKEKRRVQSW